MRFERFLRRARDLGVLGVFGLAVTACTASTAVPESVPSGTVPSSTSNSAPATKAPATTTSGASGNTRFAGKIIWAELAGYDTGNRMIEFRLLVRYPSTIKQDEYDYDQKDTVAHRLPLAAAATIAGIGGGGSQICPSSRCTGDQLIALLNNRPDSRLIAQLVVNSADAISNVNEQIGVLYN
jgi:hypothetical protein